MSEIGKPERETQGRVIALFRDGLKYDYLGDLADRPGNSNIEEGLLRANLAKRGYTKDQIDRALYKLSTEADSGGRDFYHINQAVYTTVQFVFAGSDSEGLRYGTTGTPEKFFLNWKEDEEDNEGYKLDNYLRKMCAKERLLELMHDFVLFDGGVKKVPRVHQYYRAMKAMMPSAVFIGFTGTPLLQKDKQTTLEVFGSYIHTYKFSEGVEDAVILDLIYEARDIDHNLGSQDKIDAPHCTYLYIDKSMQDHGLFQAICRTNRLDGEDKDFGYIVDYMDLLRRSRTPSRSTRRSWTRRAIPIPRSSCKSASREAGSGSMTPWKKWSCSARASSRRSKSCSTSTTSVATRRSRPTWRSANPSGLPSTRALRPS